MLDRKALVRLVPLPAAIAVLYLAFVLLCVAFGFKPSANGSYCTFGNVCEIVLAMLYLTVIGLHFHWWQKYLREYPLRLLVADELIWIVFLAAAFLNGFFLSGFKDLGGGFGEFRMSALPVGAALLVLFVVYGVLHHQRVGRYPFEAFRNAMKAASAPRQAIVAGTGEAKPPLTVKDRIAARCAALTDKELKRLCLAPLIATIFILFDSMSVFVGFRSVDNGLWIIYNFAEAVLALVFLGAVIIDFRSYRKYLKEYPFGRLIGDEVFRVLLLVAAFLNGYFFTTYTPLPNGWEVTLGGWPGGLALFILCACFEFFYHYKKVWMYPQRAHQKNWMG
jgi:hypothetical protein